MDNQNKPENNVPRRVIDFVICAVKGAVVGTGAILPGVSGGVLLVVFGIYRPLMALLSHPIRSFKTYYKLFIPFIIGWLIGFVLLARAVELLFETSSNIAISLFAGLICGTLPQLFKSSAGSGEDKGFIGFTVSLVVVYVLLSYLSTGASNAITPNIFWYFFCGATWGLSLVIPGLSSSSLLIFLGLYQPMTTGIANLDFAVMLPLLVGLVATIACTSRLVSALYEKHFCVMSRTILGVVTAATLLIIPTSFASVLDALILAACFAAGFIIARLMDIYSAKLNLN